MTNKKNIKIALIVIVIFNFFSSAQEIISKLNLKNLKENDVFQLVDKTSNEVSLYFNNNKSTLLVNLDSKFEINDSLRFTRPEKKFNSLIGFSKSNKINYLYWSKGGVNEIVAQKIDLNNKTTTHSILTFENKNEISIVKFSKDNKFYFLTILKNSNQLKLYILDGFEKTEKVIDFKNETFKNSLFQDVNLFDMLDENFLPFESSFCPQLIDDSSPVTLTSSAKRIKYYIKENRLILTFDNNNWNTYILSINLEDFSFKKQTITKPKLVEIGDTTVNSNSIIFNNTIAHIKLNPQQMILSFRDFDNNLIKEYNFSKKDSIPFKNSDIIQLGSEFNSKDIRKLDNTSQFLRKVANLNAGLSFYKIGDKYQVVIGSVSEVKNNSIMYAGMFGISGVLLHYMITNPTFDNFNSYSNRKVVYINSVFDEKGNFYSEKNKFNAFDKIAPYNTNKNSSKTIFKFYNEYIYAYFDHANNEYIFRKFKD